MKQRQIEQEMHELGVDRQRVKYAGHRRLTSETYTAGGRRLLQESVLGYERAIAEWLKRPRRPGEDGRPWRNKERLRLLPRRSTATLAARVILDGIGLARPRTSLALSIGTRIEDECRFRKTKDTHKDAWRKSQRRYKGTGYRNRRRAQLLDEARYWDTPWERWERLDRVQLGLNLLELFQAATGLIRFENRRLNRGHKTKGFVVATDETLNWLEKANEYHEVLYPVWMPTVIPPAPWKGVWGGGYHTDVLIRRPMIKTTDRDFLAHLESSRISEEVCPAINALQNTTWEINREVYEVFRHFWDIGVPIAGLPQREDEPLPPKPVDIKTNKDARGKWSKEVARIRRGNEKQRSSRISAAKLMFLTDKFLNVPRFWMPWKADWRGRFYPVPSFLQPQGTSEARGLLRFADGGPLDKPEALRWWMIHGANCWGYDKCSFDERVAWVHAHVEELLRVHQDPIANQWWTEADKPWEFLAWCLEFGDWRDEPEGFVSKVPIAMDGSNNGLQIFSLLLRDPSGASATNCTYSDDPQDIYQDVADRATLKLREAAEAGHKYAPIWLEFFEDGKVPRKCAKRPVMTLPYGATEFAAIRYVREWFLEALGTDDLHHYSPFGCDGYKPCTYLARLIWKSIHEVVVKARECMEWLQGVAETCYEHDVVPQWETPTGFVVRHHYPAWLIKQVYSAIGDIISIHSNVQVDSGAQHRRRNRNGISPNYVHSLDAAVLVRTINAARAEGIENFAMIHDSYGTTAANAPALARILREQYAALFSEDLLEDFRSQIQALLPKGVELPPVPPPGDLDVNEVKAAPYFFA